MTDKEVQLKNIETTIQAFEHKGLYDSNIDLFKSLGYKSKKTDRITPSNFNGLLENFSIPKNSISKERALSDQWKQIEFIFQLGTSEMQEQESLFQETFNRNEPSSYLFFSIELIGKEYTRNQLSQIARELNKPFPMNVFVLFKYGNHLTLSLIDKRQNKKILHKDVVEKITHLFNINIQKPHSAHIRILQSFSYDAIVSDAPKKRVTSFAELHLGWRKVISTDILNKQFYLDYSALSVKLIKAIHPVQIQNKLIAHQGILNLLNRIMFIYFVQKKEWIMEDENFVIHFWRDYKNSKQHNNFHEHWLNTIFFYAFNGKAWKGHKSFKFLPVEIQAELPNFPYLNGGLFAYNEEFDHFILDDKAIGDIFGFFENYIFTISEDTPYDVNLEINPELLGKMYEGMINATDLNDVDAENGIIYTERPEINFMTRRSFVEVLDKKMNSALSRDFLYHFIFDEPKQKIELLSHYKVNIPQLRDAIKSITICDPACGSGSMLLGVIQLQMELLRVLDEFDHKPHSPKDDFNIKKQLVSECIYGVDIKEWAVRIAELRLWLYMIAEAEFSKEELSKSPLLPNLDFKLRRGNSLLQKIGSLDFSVEELFKGRNKNTGAARKLNEFIKKKKTFILNQEESQTTYEKLKSEEYAVFMQFVIQLIIEFEQRHANLGKSPTQGFLFPEPTQTEIDLYAEEREKLKNEIDQLKRLKANIHKENKLPFSFDIDFMEIFLTNDDPGFDLIIGNPPYVRQEQILPPEDGEYLEKLLLPENKDEKTKINKAYKEELSAKVFKTYPFLSATVKTQIDGKSKVIPVYGTKVPGRSDLYSYFQLLCPAYLNSKGTFCFIISNSWLDVDFGSFVQQFLLKHTNLYAVYDCNVRSFEAAVNTIIYLHSSLTNIPTQLTGVKGNYKIVPPIDQITRFIMNKIDYMNAAYAPFLLEQEHCTKNTFRDLYRTIALTQKELFSAGYDDEQRQFTGDKWGGKYLRAPEIYYTILEKGKDKLIRLGDIAEVRFGIKTGANEFFVLDKEDIQNRKIELKYLIPFFTSPKDSCSIFVDEESLRYFLFNCNDSIDKLQGSTALEYINWGKESIIINGKEVRAFNKRSSVAGRMNWYSIGKRTKPSFNCNYMIDSIMRFFHGQVHAINNFHEIHYNGNFENELSICLNSSLTQFFVNILGRSNLGDGLLKIEGFEVADLLVLDPELVNNPVKTQIEFERRPLKDIFTELGFNRTDPIRDQQPNPLPDRKELDDIIFDELGLTRAERDEVYWSLAELVKQRLDKASSR